MRYRITKECASCGQCEEVCPNEAIAPDKKSIKLYKQMVIDEKKCKVCGECYEICPQSAIIEIEDDEDDEIEEDN